jgi:hypothetical protein
VSGSVTNRIDGATIDGSQIRFAGQATATASVVGGRYRIDQIPAGAYTVTVTGPSHVDHQTDSILLTLPSTELNFTVLKWGTGRFGVVYDQQFHDFFNLVARDAGETTTGVTHKWRQPPGEIYVVNEGISPDALADFLVLLGEVNAESLPDLFGQTAQPVPVVTGPAPTGGLYVSGTITVSFAAGSTNSGGPGCQVAANLFDCGHVQIGLAAFADPSSTPYPPRQRKYYILHEMMHVAGSCHAYNGAGASYAVDNESVMGSGKTRGSPPTSLPPVDRFAMWLLYLPATAPGNAYPDKNPSL